MESILGESVTCKISPIREIHLTNFDLVVPDLDLSVMTAAYVRCKGEINVGIMMYLSEPECRMLVPKLIGTMTCGNSDDLTMSVIAEMGNMIAASISNTLSVNTKYGINSSVPGCAIESFRTLWDAAVSDFGNQSDTLVVSTVEMRGRRSGIVVNLLLINDSAEMPKLLIQD